MKTSFPSLSRRLVWSLLLCAAAAAQAQVPGNPYSYSRTSSFTYYGAADGAKNGLLASETVEPGNAQLCVTTTYDYDAYGNKQSAATANCAGASGRAVFTSRSSSSTYAAVASQTIVVNGANVTVAIAAGLLADSSANAQSQSENKTYDPRFGAALSLTGPNSLTTRWTLDDFGRRLKELRADNTSTVSSYCYIARNGGTVSIDTSQPSSPTCPAPDASEVPADAVMFVHSEPKDTGGTKMGPFVRVYSDRLGREIRSATEGFDGASQPTPGAVIVKDTVYNQYGAKVIETQPYFLATGSSTSGGSNNVGASFLVYDVIGRPTDAYAIDAQGQGPGTTSATFSALGFASGASVSYGIYIIGAAPTAHTSFAYSGLSTTTTNDKTQTRTEEKNAIGEVVRVTDAAGAQLAHQRDAFGNLVATKDALQNTITLSYDIRGRKTQMVDPDTGTWNYAYDALGQLVWQQSPNELAQGANVATTMAYDLLGRMTSRSEPEYVSSWYFDKNQDGSYCMAGTVLTRGAGKLCESKTSSGIDRKLIYDSLGRPVNSRTDTGTGPSFAGALVYDTTTGRIASQTYPTGLAVQYNYTAARGFLQSLTLLTAATVNPLPNSQGQTASGTTLAAGAALWTAQVANAWGKAEQQAYGNGVIGSAAYEAATGRVTSLTAGTSGSVLSQSYTWDSLNNLTGRTDNNGDTSSGISTGAVSETFVYGDSLNRLTQYQVSAPAIAGLSRTVNLQYNALGMLLYKSDVGVYAYGAQNTAGVRPHALQSVATGSSTTTYGYDANGNLITASAGSYRSVSYTSFNLPDSQNGMQGPGGAPKYTWQYDEDHARIKETRVNAGGTRTTWYLHPDNQGGLGFECDTASTGAADCSASDTSNRHYLSAGGQVIGVLISNGALPTLAAGQTWPSQLASIVLVKVEYWHKDHLGSLIATTDHNGAVTQRYAYDPFGKRRYTNGSYDEFGNVIVDWSSTLNWGTDRGFTGHEHLDDIGLVNMNGRIFDPTLGVFLQADPFIQDPDNLQNYNRYGYCLNNPLTCTDPSGHNWLTRHFNRIIHSAVRLGYEMSLLKVFGVSYQDFRIIASIAAAVALGPVPGAGGWGAFAQAAEAGFVSGAIASESVSGGIRGAFSAGAFFGAGNLIQGGNFFTGGIDKAAAWGTAGGIALHGVVGCVTSVAGGGKCGSGALSAAFTKAAAPGIMDLTGGDKVLGALAGAVIGGTASALGGGKFSNGAVTGAFSYLFNELMHRGYRPDYADSPEDRLRQGGYLPTQYPNGAVCNSSASACTAGVGTDAETGRAAVALMTLATAPIGIPLEGAAGAGVGFFEGAVYTDKVLRQMGVASDLYHAFPAAIDTLAAEAGQVTRIVGGDGAAYVRLQAEGMLNNVRGVFEYIKDAAGNINHRLFVPARTGP